MEEKQSFNNAFAEALKNLAIEPKNNDSEEENDDAAEDELGGEPEEETPAAEEVYNADTGFIPPIEETPVNNSSSASNPFVGG